MNTLTDRAATVPAIVLGGTGYVAGELLRLLCGHPRLRIAAVMSDSQPGEPVAGAFPHLAPVLADLRFSSEADIAALLTRLPAAAMFGAAPHGVSAALIDRLLGAAEGGGCALRVVDISADFRYADPGAYEAVYKHPHGAPARLGQFTCAVPEHLPRLVTSHVGHPGCFATAILLASVPLLARNLIEPQLFVAGITGSTGSGRKPTEGTHHPLRHGDLYSYNALGHRHAPEVAACALAASGVAAQFAFVPHSGPFARGIHVTVQARLRGDDADVLEQLRDYYARSPFVRVTETAPRLKNVVASNYAQLSATATSGTVAVTCAIDNLTKGAAGGAVQWMNRMLGFEERSGLAAPAPGWT
ncbi:MAG: N-acetyl-gamma-glutamyl-phosphate reductase [Steroidobacteraceae bacterium]